MAVARLALSNLDDGEVRLSDEVELYQRTYTTLLRSSGETHLRVLESSHRAMGSSLHPLAASDELDLGRVHLRDPPAARRDRRRQAGRDGPGRRGAGRRRDPGRGLGGGRGPGASPALVRRRRGHARGAAGERLRRRRPGADARRVPDRVEQDPRSHARRGLAVPRVDRRPARRAGARARRQRRGLGPAARGVGRPLRRADAADRGPAAVAARADARRHQHRLLASDPALVGTGQRRAGRRAAERPALLRQLQHPQPRQHRHRHRPGARRRADRVRREDGRGRHPPPGADRLPRRQGRGLVGELPVLRRARCTSTRGGPEGAAERRARSSRTASPTCAAHGAARPGPGHPAGRARPRRAGPARSATSTPTRWPPARRRS